MSILDVNGRPRSVRTEDEELRLLLEDIERLPEDEQRALKEVYARLIDGEAEPYSGLADAEYRVAPVDIKTFLSDPYFLGETGASLWPRLADDIAELFEGEYEEATLGGSLGWGKCVTADTEVYDTSSGARRRVDELGSFETASMDSRGLVLAERATAIRSGRKECVRLTLKDGRAVSLSLDHQVFTGRGWVESGDLTANDLVAVPRVMPGADSYRDMTDAEVKLVAYLASDGGLAGSGVTFTNAQPSVLREVADCVEEVGDASRSTWGQVGTSDLGRRGKAKTIGLKGIRWFAAEMGLTCKAVDKRLPAWTYGLPKKQVALLLNRFWSCDGSVSPKKPQKAEVTLASERLIDDLQFLLSRLGVLSRKTYKASSYKDDEGERRWFDAWRLTVTGAENILTFLHEVGDILGKEQSCSALRDACSLLTPNSNTDVVPVANDALREMGRESGIKGLTSTYGVSGHWMGRMRFKRLCQETGYSGEKAWLAGSDVAWESVKSIENIGEQEVYDLSVENTHNFVGNGIVLHNSFFSTTAMAYTIYQMSCLKNPQRAYGIDIGSHIYVAMISVTEKVAKRVVINELIGKIRHSRYFQEHFKPKEAPSQLEVRFPNNIQVVAGSTSSSAMIGLNVFSGLIDECVAGWTRVLTPNGYKTIEELYRGDGTITPIMAYSEKDGCVVRASGRIKRATNTKTFDVVLSNGAVITATSEHPFLVRGHGYVPLERLCVGDEVVVVDAEEIQQEKLRGGRESVSQQEAFRGVKEEDLEVQGWCEASADVQGDKKEDCSCQCQNKGDEAGDRYQWGSRKRAAGVCGCGEVFHPLPESLICPHRLPLLARPLTPLLCPHPAWLARLLQRIAFLPVRAIRRSIHERRQATMDTAGFLGQKDGWFDGDDRGQAEGVFEVGGEQVEIRGLSNLLQEKGVDLRDLGRGSDLARIVSIRASGDHQTFDVMSVPYGNFVAEGAVVHNTSFLGESKKLDRHGREVVVDMGEQIYKSIIRRMKSRFQRVGRLPGVLILASSKERPSAFIEKRVQQAREVDDPMVFVREYATWDVHPAEKFSGKFFKVVVGTERISSRILSSDPEEEQRYRDLGLQIVTVPEDYRPDFVNDIDGALRDIAGVATDVISQYMNRTEKVYDCQDATLEHPIGHDEGEGAMEEWVANTPLPIQWHRITKPFKRRLPGGYEEDAWRPIRHPEAARFAHIDTSYSGDCSGICIAHIAGWTEVVRRDAYGEEYNELAPRIEADLVLGVVPPPGDEIMLADLRGIIYQFMAHGFNVSYVSLDSFQSIDTIQQLRKHGVDSEVVSIDKTTEPYDTLKTTMYEDRFRMAPHSVALREFRYLQRVPKSGGRVKIDHPKKNPDGTPGSKDVADAVAGVVYALTKKVPGRPLEPIMSSRESFDEKVDDSWVTGGKVLVQSTKQKGQRQSLVSDHDGRVGVPGGGSSLPFLKG